MWQATKLPTVQKDVRVDKNEAHRRGWANEILKPYKFPTVWTNGKARPEKNSDMEKVRKEKIRDEENHRGKKSEQEDAHAKK